MGRDGSEIQWLTFENLQSPIYVVNIQFSRRADRSYHNLALLSHFLQLLSKGLHMRYSMTLYLKIYWKYNRSNLKHLNLLTKTLTFNFDLSYFWYLLRYRVIQYLIGNSLVVANMSQEGLVVASLLISVRVIWTVTFCYINGGGALLKLNSYTL